MGVIPDCPLVILEGFLRLLAGGEAAVLVPPVLGFQHGDPQVDEVIDPAHVIRVVVEQDESVDLRHPARSITLRIFRPSPCRCRSGGSCRSGGPPAPRLPVPRRFGRCGGSGCGWRAPDEAQNGQCGDESLHGMHLNGTTPGGILPHRRSGRVMRHQHLLLLAVALVEWESTAAAQTRSRPVSGTRIVAQFQDRATVCGTVIATSCRQGSGTSDVFLRLTPLPDGKPVAFRIPGQQRESFGMRLDERLVNEGVCATGTMTTIGGGYRVTVTEPRDFAPAAPQTIFAPEVRSACDVGVEPPTLVSSAATRYSADAMRRKVQGGVLLLAVVQSDGSVGEVKVQRPLDPDVDADSVAALRTWQFRPGAFHGEPAPVVISVETNFAIRKPGR